ncbi:site-specific integrase [Janthinobacterium sp.]|uniref:site-specific integrase n=1 Tax=Janthinobacterium sp. TaxID=1871054 RepID=UPI00260B895F|nr:site-specific integrase [Janthinobacterium sp.]
MTLFANENNGTPVQWDLPAIVSTRNGVTFDPRCDVWSYVDGTKSIYINLTKLVNIGKELLWGITKTLIWFSENMAPRTLTASFNDFCVLLKSITENHAGPLLSITGTDLLNGRAALRDIYHNDSHLRRCRPFLKKLSKLGYPGISPCGQKYLKELTLKTSATGTSTTLLDPHQGPFTDLERESILDALCAGYACGLISIERYVLAWLIALFGQRPTQYAMLKLCDFLILKDGDCTRHVLRIPLAKGKNEVDRNRAQEFDLIPELALLIIEYKSRILLQFTGVLADPEQAPFFPSRSARRKANANGLEYHMLSVTITDELRRTYLALDVKSERTGKQINFNTYRFRRTVGTNCIREGLGIMGTAMRLGQTTTLSVRCYVSLAAAFELHDRIEFSTAARLGTLAQVFKGVLVTTETDKNPAPISHIVNPLVDPTMKSPMGSCGKDSFCSFNKPIACYSCLLFRAWLDGPHQKVYDYLEADKQRLIDSGCPDTIVRINNRALLAVASVIMMCKEEYAKRALAVLSK